MTLYYHVQPRFIAEVAAVLALFVFAMKAIGRRRMGPRPPGPSPAPLVGNFFQIPKRKTWETFKRWSEECNSDIIYLDVAGRPILILNSYESAMELLDKRSLKYSSRPHFVILEEVLDYKSVGTLPYGDDWRLYRRLFQRALNSTTAKDYRPYQIASAKQLTYHMLQRPERFLSDIRYAAASNVLRIAYGINVPEDDPYIGLAEQHIRMVGSLLRPGSHLVESLPLLQYAPSWFPGASFKRKVPEWKELLRKQQWQLFGQLKQRMAEGIQATSFASYNLENLNPAKDKEKQETAIRGVAASIYTAGTDTTTATVSCFIADMVMHPEVQKKAQAEIDELLKGSRLPSFEDQDFLPYVSAVAKETFRLHPVAPLGLAHYLEVDDEYRGYVFPKGTTVLVNQWALTRDEAAYPDPEEYRPERFLKDGKLDPKVRDPSNIGFGFGRRICPGRHLAEASLWITLASILAVFDIAKPDDAGADYEIVYKAEGIFAPESFKCSIKPRSAKAEELILQSQEQTN